MSKRKIIPDPLLMLVTILIVTGFQVYWLKDNYDRENRTLKIKASTAFQETIRHQQTLKLKLQDLSLADTVHRGKMKIFVSEEHHPTESQGNVFPRTEIITMVNTIRDKLKDSLKGSTVNSALIISKDSSFRDSVIEELRGGAGVNVFRYLYRVDSLQDSLKIPEITADYQKKMQEENIAVPFEIVRLNKVTENEDPDFFNVTVGFAHPVTYHLELKNSFPYLMKRLTLPILFSVFLVGVTILSFVALYRNLLKQQRLTDLKNEFIGNITHELKTPIATVGVAIEALKSFNAIHDPERTREYLDISSNELQRLNLLVDKVLKLSMFESREVDLKYESVDLKDVVDEVVASMRLQLEKLHAVLSIKQSGDTNLEADRLHLLSVVFNLLDNALKYAKGDPVINIDLDGNSETVRLKMADNGIGIAAEYKNKIFEKFFRVPTGNMHNAKGYGLGLSYVAHVVEKHRGKISVDSELNKGTTIIVTLPKKRA
jgi:two-component system phosphate regulon sensor histidine kinase PhoR